MLEIVMNWSCHHWGNLGLLERCLVMVFHKLKQVVERISQRFPWNRLVFLASRWSIYRTPHYQQFQKTQYRIYYVDENPCVESLSDVDVGVLTTWSPETLTTQSFSQCRFDDICHRETSIDTDLINSSVD
uniref:Uncharacterized protein n=1 Tax=Rodentolepis nana TaxID=102285 RepID=A0A0R3T687_RODNA